MVTARRGDLILILALFGCASEQIVEEGPRELVAERSVTFGDEEGEGTLSNVFGVAASPDGHVFLSEPQFARVVEFNRDGTFARVVGGRGDGPGEFGIPGALWWRGDSLAVTDFRLGISLFAPDGTFEDRISFNVNDGSSAFGVRPILPLADGSVAAFAPAGSSEIVRGSVTHETWLKTSRDGALIDTLIVLDLEGRLYSVRYEGRGRSVEHPLSWAPLLAAVPAGTSLVVVDRPPATDDAVTSFRIVRIGLGGDTLDAATLEYEPVPVRAAEIDSIATAMAQGWAESMNLPVPVLAAEIAKQIDWPAYQPPVTVALAGADGSVWLRRELVGASAARWEVLDEELTPIGRVHLPLGLDVKVVARDHVYGVEKDDFDVPRVVRIDVREP